MATENEKIFLKLKRQIANVKDKLLFTKDIQKIGKDIAVQIRKRTRLGKGVKNGKTYKLAPLKDATIDIREFYAENLDFETTPRRSNLTATGQMLNALTSKTSKNKIEIFFKRSRRRELIPNSKKRTNDFVARQARKGASNRVPRPFFELSNFEKNKIIRETRKLVLERFKGITSK